MQTRATPDLETVKNLAKYAEIQNYSDFRKSSFAQLKDTYDIKRLERAALRGKKSDSHDDCKRKRDHEVTSSKRDKKTSKSNKKCNQITCWDPISLAPIDLCQDKSKIVTFNNGAHSYFANTISEYLIATEDFRDPISRVPFTLQDIEKICQVPENSLRTTLLEQFQQWSRSQNTNTSRQQTMKLQCDALHGVERLCGETVASMLQCIEAAALLPSRADGIVTNDTEEDEDEDYDDDNNENDDEDHQLQEIILLTDVFPSFEWYFGQLIAMDTEFANMSLKAWISYIKGPPNRRHSAADWSLKQAVLRFLNDKMRLTTTSP